MSQPGLSPYVHSFLPYCFLTSTTSFDMMTTDPKQSEKGRDGALSVLGIAIEGLNLAEISSITPAKAVFGSANVILAMIKVRSFLLFCGDGLQLHGHSGLYG